ncbi:39S ribosomal protein L16, mitochondrial [Lingula anatina]|uniref:Large ribosomal subunit protein uL16m n=1 Tax=Lingula anatina TaxID=7574 RepID=A0A1S3HC27_LINAN|nr:39S ribosomal protein L16, mitochondrial [Lingula anatina]|eukprot:XP_013383577.1 39S ribosomal protein L16, mitochondrial [Lingula anatina]
MSSVILRQSLLRSNKTVLMPCTVLPMATFRKKPKFNPKPPQDYSWVKMPERGKLKLYERIPQPNKMQVRIWGEGRIKETSRSIDTRGPELFHNNLNHKQFGIRALQGGELKWGHFEMMRININKIINEDNMFAVWRVPAPNKPVTNKTEGARMGGGKGPIKYYVTPVKAGRIILEVGGHCEYKEVSRVLELMAANLPFKAEAITHEMLLEEQERKEFIEKNNKNPFDFRFMLKHNINGCRRYAGRYDWKWQGKYK